MKDDKPMYGIWVSNKGWLRGEKDAISFYDRSFAVEVAGILSAQVRRIDESWKDLEQFYLEQEGKSIWRTLVNLLHSKSKSSVSNK